MKKRDFLKTAGILTLGAIVTPLSSCTSPDDSGNNTNKTPNDEASATSNFELPKLAFDVAALEPHIDKRTMEIHHGKHHAGYVKKLNAALEKAETFKGKTIEVMLAELQDTDAHTAVRNNGGGHYNHTLFWKSLTPGKDASNAPEGVLATAINSEFGSFENFKKTFSDHAAGQFGSGWAWLSIGSDSKLFVSSTPNQDNPLMKELVEKAGTPLLGLDVWEHAYYLNYQNRRKDYINAFFNVVNWDAVSTSFSAAVG